jgi:hypothetical protein
MSRKGCRRSDSPDAVCPSRQDVLLTRPSDPKDHMLGPLAASPTTLASNLQGVPWTLPKWGHESPLPPACMSRLLSIC